MARVRYCKDLFVVSFYLPSAVSSQGSAVWARAFRGTTGSLSQCPLCVCVCVCVHAGSSGHLLVRYCTEVKDVRLSQFCACLWPPSFPASFLGVCVCVCVVLLQNSQSHTHTLSPDNVSFDAIFKTFIENETVASGGRGGVGGVVEEGAWR